jgi:hypothetical protein
MIFWKPSKSLSDAFNTDLEMPSASCGKVASRFTFTSHDHLSSYFVLCTFNFKGNQFSYKFKRNGTPNKTNKFGHSKDSYPYKLRLKKQSIGCHLLIISTQTNIFL